MKTRNLKKMLKKDKRLSELYNNTRHFELRWQQNLKELNYSEFSINFKEKVKWSNLLLLELQKHPKYQESWYFACKLLINE